VFRRVQLCFLAAGLFSLSHGSLRWQQLISSQFNSMARIHNDCVCFQLQLNFGSVTWHQVCFLMCFLPKIP
jgi:hypothetical protein